MKGSYYHHHNRHAAPAAADALEDGLSPLLQPAKPQHQPLYYDDDKRKGHRRRGRRHGRSSSSPVAVVLSFVLLAAAACLLVWRARAGVGVGGEGGAMEVVTRAKKAAVESFNVKTLVQQGIEEGQKGPKQREQQPPQRQDQAVGADDNNKPKPEEPAAPAPERPLPRSIETWEERQASGRHVLATGVDVALQELLETRGFANSSRVMTPNWEGALSFFTRAAELFSQTYDGKDEVIESDYFDAMELQALLRLHEGKCEDVDALLDAAQRRIDLDPKERSAVALLRGYCEEGQGSSKAGMYFSLAREYDEGCHETLLDVSYQPPEYGGLSARMPSGVDGYWGHLVDLLVFRSLYTHRARLANEGSTWPGGLWAPEAQAAGDAYGANLGWGLNRAGVAKAGEVFRGQDFVVLREFLHPFELAVLERYYRAKAVNGLPFDPNLGRISSYQDRVGMWLNHRMTQLIASFVGRPVKHAYSFLCHYEKRDGVVPNLQPHTDREDNQYTVSIQIYADQEEPLWPIYVHTPSTLPEHSGWRALPSKSESVECGVRNGDALLFLGRRHIHFRDDMPEELNVVASLLLHFVDREFDLFDFKARQTVDSTI